MTPILAESLAQMITDFLNCSDFCGVILAAIVHVALLGAFFGLPAGVFIWAERKVSGRIQDRLGPTRTGGMFGWLQSLADGAKLIQKEDLAPKAADSALFRIAPYVVVIASFAAFMFLPFADGWSAVSVDVGLFLMLAMLSLEVIGVILAGYSSGSKWALFGAMREAAQMISYEIPMAICALVPIVLAGSLNLNEIVHLQSGPGFRCCEGARRAAAEGGFSTVRDVCAATRRPAVRRRRVRGRRRRPRAGLAAGGMAGALRRRFCNATLRRDVAAVGDAAPLARRRSYCISRVVWPLVVFTLRVLLVTGAHLGVSTRRRGP